MSGQSSGGKLRKLEPMGKRFVPNHGHAPAQRHRQETRAVERKTRQAGKKEIERETRQAAQGESVAECIAALRATL